LKSLSPISVEFERCFSASGNIVTKLRCSMNDNTLDAISFLRSHFIKTDIEQQQKKSFLVVVVEKRTLNEYENDKSYFLYQYRKYRKSRKSRTPVSIRSRKCRYRKIGID
jgi:hypothetical protein